MDLYYSVSNFIWSDSFWFPEKYSWKDLENKPGGIYHPQFTDLLVPFPTALCLFFIRCIFERFISNPLGLWLGVKATIEKPSFRNDQLEAAYNDTKQPDHTIIQALSKQSDLTIRQIERWFRQRRNQDRSSQLTKFSECSWRFTFYASAFIGGIVVLYDKAWFWDTKHCWYDYPHQHISADIYWYYMIEMAFYWSLMMSQFQDVQRKDFWEMLIHHCVTLMLIFFSWINNMVRIGTLVLCIHDAVDPFLEAAKMAKYASMQKVCDVLFGLFALIWFITRMIIYPARMINSSLLESSYIIGHFHSIYLFNALLCLLLVLHTIWFYLILIGAYRAIKTGKVQKDERSEEEDEDEDEMSEEIGDTSRSKSHSKINGAK